MICLKPNPTSIQIFSLESLPFPRIKELIFSLEAEFYVSKCREVTIYLKAEIKEASSRRN